MARDAMAWSKGFDQDSEDARPSEVRPRAVEGASRGQKWALDALRRAEVERRAATAAVDKRALRARKSGLSWASIGWALGMSGQAAHKRYGERAGR